MADARRWLRAVEGRSRWQARLTVLAVAVVGLLAGPARAQLRVVSYNIAQLRGDTDALQAVMDALEVDDQPGFATPVGIYVFQEVQNEDIDVLFSVLPSGFALATYTNTNEDDFGGAQALFYRVPMLTEDVDEHRDIFTGAGRRADRWRLELAGYDSVDAGLYVYGIHLKAGSLFEDEAQRLDGVIAVRADAATLAPGMHVIYAGDMNLSSSTEDAYVEFLGAAPSPGQAFDPLSPLSWAGAANAIKHTQSPCESSCLPNLTGGGMDDRFDFQLITDALQDDDGLTLIAGTYRALGNDGDHYNDAINDGVNTYYPADVTRSNALADVLHDASDHLPLVADYQIPAILDAFLEPSYGRVIEGAVVDVIYIVSNDVDVDDPIGGDTLDVLVIGSDGFEGSFLESLPALSGPLISTFTLDTSTAGDIDGTVTFTALNEGAQNSPVVLTAAGTVLRPANPSFQPDADVDDMVVELAVEADQGVQLIDVDVHNLGHDELQALLDLDGVSPARTPFGFEGGLASGIGADPATLTFSFDTTALADGAYEQPVTITTSDEDLDGESSSQLDLTLSVQVGTRPACEADLDGSLTVDIADLLSLLSSWGRCAGCPADFDDSGVVDIADLLTLLGEWGDC